MMNGWLLTVPSPLSSLPSPLLLHYHAEGGGDVAGGGRREIVQVHAAGAFIVEQRSRLAAPLGLGQLFDPSGRERAGVVAMRALSAGRVKRRQPAKMHRPGDWMWLARAAIGRGFRQTLFGIHGLPGGVGHALYTAKPLGVKIGILSAL